MSTDLEAELSAAYDFEAPGVTFGAGMRGEEALPAVQVRAPLSMLNRHGLVSGATGTGKTKTLQVLAEQLSDAGVPVFISDIKGDISGLAAPAELNDKLTGRASAIGFADYAPRPFPVEFLSLDRDGELTALGTGEALITALDLKGRPLPTVRTMMRPPMSLMAQVAPSVVDGVVASSSLVPTYAADTDPESARFARSGTFNTIARSILGILSKRR